MEGLPLLAVFWCTTISTGDPSPDYDKPFQTIRTALLSPGQETRIVALQSGITPLSCRGKGRGNTERDSSAILHAPHRGPLTMLSRGDRADLQVTQRHRPAGHGDTDRPAAACFWTRTAELRSKGGPDAPDATAGEIIAGKRAHCYCDDTFSCTVRSTFEI